MNYEGGRKNDIGEEKRIGREREDEGEERGGFSSASPAIYVLLTMRRRKPGI